MTSRAELEQQKYENAISSLENRVPNATKVKELENLKEYLTTKINQGVAAQKSGQLDTDIINTDASLSALKRLRDRLVNSIKKTKSEIQQQTQWINKKDQEIAQREEQIRRQEHEINYKKNLLITRDRMLELSQEKNVYKKKVIFTLLAVIFAIALLMALSFLYLRR